MPEHNNGRDSKAAGLRLILVRHGQTDSNRNRWLQGQSDGQLNEEGRLQMQDLGEALKDMPIDRIYSSDLVRARDTALAVARYHDVPMVVSEQLREWNVGVLDGQPAEVFWNLLDNDRSRLATFQPEGGETMVQVRQRAAGFLEQVTRQHPGETVVLCSHGDFLRMVLSAALNLDIEAASHYHFDNASYSILEWDGKNWYVAALNQVSPSRQKREDQTNGETK